MTSKYCYIVNDKFFYFGRSKELSLKHLDQVRQVLESYKVPKHLTNVMIVIQTVKEADKGLVFKGQDSKDRWQYFYGRQYTSNRAESRLDTLKKVNSIWPQLLERIDMLLEENVGSKNLQIGLVLSLLTKLFIRTGKHIHYRTNKTQGLITLQKRNISFGSFGNIRIQFIGKDNVTHDITLFDKVVYKKLQAQLEPLKQNDFIFLYKTENNTVEVIKEFVIYEFLDEFNIRPKDIRTYGANIAFLEYYLKGLKDLKQKDGTAGISYKKILAKAVEDAAVRIGHTKNVSKKSYISQQLYRFIESIEDKLDDINISRVLKKTATDLLQFFLQLK